jgi:FkbM family methyltransferase
MNIAKILQASLKLIPKKLAICIAKKNPRIARKLPSGINATVKYYNKYNITLDTTYPIEREMVSGIYSPQIIKILEFFLKPKDIVIDVGANVGGISMVAAALVSSEGLVISVEPGKITSEKLINFKEYNNIDNLRIIQVGLSDKEGFLNWVMDEENPGNASLIMNSDGDQVIVKTLDNLFNELKLPYVSFIKIDVEGMELEVLKGSLNTINKHKPIILFETMEAWKKIKGINYFEEIENLLRKNGYKLYSSQYPYSNEININQESHDTIAIHKDTIASNKSK